MKTKILCISLWLLLVFVCFTACTADATADPTDSDEQTKTDVLTEAPTLADTAPQKETAETATETESSTEPVTDTLLLPSDFTTELYSVKKIDGVCYLNFNDGNQGTSDNEDNLNYVFTELYFDSYEKLRESFLNGQLSNDVIETMKQQFQQTDQGIVVPDIVNMGKPSAPTNATIHDKISWTGTQLSYNVDSDFYDSWGFLTVNTQAAYEDFYAQNYENARENFTVISETDGTFDGVPCKIYDIENKSGHYRDIVIEVTRNQQSFQIYMRYVLDHYNDLLPESDIAPYHVYVFSESNEQKYILQQYTFKETPSLDWLTSFVLEPVSK